MHLIGRESGFDWLSKGKALIGCYKGWLNENAADWIRMEMQITSEFVLVFLSFEKSIPVIVGIECMKDGMNDELEAQK